jgi:predicted DNA-binding transcriptional regulator AlpA
MTPQPTPSDEAKIVKPAQEKQSRGGSRANAMLGGSQRGVWPAVLDVPQAARLLGIGRTLAYELIRTDQWPTPVLRIGRLIRIPSRPLIELISAGYPTQSGSG